VTLEGLIAEYRLLANDDLDPPWVTDTQLWTFFAEAESEAAIRGRLLLETTDPAVCQVGVTAGAATYRLHPALFEVTHAAFSPDTETARSVLTLVSPEWLDPDPDATRSRCHDGYDTPSREDWRTDGGRPRVALHTGSSLLIVPTPNIAGTLHLEGYRTPLGATGSDPEIAAVHHRQLIQWALYRGLGVPGAEQQDPARAALALTQFERYFGLRPDSDLRRETRSDLPHHVVAHWV
jgi:hypothetical protein